MRVIEARQVTRMEGVGRGIQSAGPCVVSPKRTVQSQLLGAMGEFRNSEFCVLS